MMVSNDLFDDFVVFAVATQNLHIALGHNISRRRYIRYDALSNDRNSSFQIALKVLFVVDSILSLDVYCRVAVDTVDTECTIVRDNS